jgi:hypothetical protein
MPSSPANRLVPITTDIASTSDILYPTYPTHVIRYRSHAYQCRYIYRLTLCTGLLVDETTRFPTAVPNPEGGNDIYTAIKK